MSDAAIRTQSLTKDFGSGHGIFDLDLEIRRGEIFGFLGPNGAGKSTTMRLLLGLLAPTTGTAELLGLDSAGDGIELHRRLGYLPGDFQLYPKLPGADVLRYLADLRGGVDQSRIDALAERFGADLSRPIHELSTGNRQKIGLIQAFMHEPELLILDEPIAGLDPLVQQRFHALLAEVAAHGATVFLSSHTLSEVERVAERVAIVRDGRLVVVDTLENLRSVAVRRLEVEFAGEPPDRAALLAVAGVGDVSWEAGHAIISYEGSVDPLIKALAAHDVRSVHSRDDDLERIFLGYYSGETGEGA
jgi:ABC-2 type transport system ATP-binding protein